MPASPAFTPSVWPSDPPAPTTGPPASFSFGDAEPLEPVAVEPAPVTASPPRPAPASADLALTSAPGADAHQLERELAAAQEELRALHEMLEDLPEIFERKFQQRLATVMEHQKHLLADNQALRERLYSLNPAEADPASSNRPLLLPTVAPSSGWGQALRRALRLDRLSGNGARSGKNAPRGLNRHDDGRPISA